MLLLDEVEEAHPDVFDVLLQVLDDGQLTDGSGNKVDFKNTVVIMTSNIGTHEIQQELKEFEEQISAAETPDAMDALRTRMNDRIAESVSESLKARFKPEFINRLTGVIVCEALTPIQIHSIARVLLKRALMPLEEKGYSYTVDEKVYEALAARGYELLQGARPLRRLIEKEIQNPLATYLLEQTAAGAAQAGGEVYIYVKGENEFAFDFKPFEAESRRHEPTEELQDTFMNLIKACDEIVEGSPDDFIAREAVESLLKVSLAAPSGSSLSGNYGCFWARTPLDTVCSNITAANHSNPSLKDRALNTMLDEVKQGVAPEYFKLIKRWMKQFAREAKEYDPGRTVTFGWKQNEDGSVVVEVNRKGKLNAQEERALRVNLTPEITDKETAAAVAQQLVDSDEQDRDKSLIDIKASVAQAGDARFGFDNSNGGVRYWLALPKFQEIETPEEQGIPATVDTAMPLDLIAPAQEQNPENETAVAEQEDWGEEEWTEDSASFQAALKYIHSDFYVEGIIQAEGITKAGVAYDVFLTCGRDGRGGILLREQGTNEWEVDTDFSYEFWDILQFTHYEDKWIKGIKQAGSITKEGVTYDVYLSFGGYGEGGVLLRKHGTKMWKADSQQYRRILTQIHGTSDIEGIIEAGSITRGGDRYDVFLSYGDQGRGGALLRKQGTNTWIAERNWFGEVLKRIHGDSGIYGILQAGVVTVEGDRYDVYLSYGMDGTGGVLLRKQGTNEWIEENTYTTKDLLKKIHGDSWISGIIEAGTTITEGGRHDVYLSYGSSGSGGVLRRKQGTGEWREGTSTFGGVLKRIHGNQSVEGIVEAGTMNRDGDTYDMYLSYGGKAKGGVLLRKRCSSEHKEVELPETDRIDQTSDREPLPTVRLAQYRDAENKAEDEFNRILDDHCKYNYFETYRSEDEVWDAFGAWEDATIQREAIEDSILSNENESGDIDDVLRSKLSQLQDSLRDALAKEKEYKVKNKDSERSYRELYRPQKPGYWGTDDDYYYEYRLDSYRSALSRYSHDKKNFQDAIRRRQNLEEEIKSIENQIDALNRNSSNAEAPGQNKWPEGALQKVRSFLLGADVNIEFEEGSPGFRSPSYCMVNDITLENNTIYVKYRYSETSEAEITEVYEDVDPVGFLEQWYSRHKDDLLRCYYGSHCEKDLRALQTSMLMPQGMRESGYEETLYQDLINQDNMIYINRVREKYAREIDGLFSLCAQRDMEDITQRFGFDDDKEQADYLLVCGNDDVRVFEEAVTLYHSGVAKKLILSGGHNRLTKPLKRVLERVQGFAVTADFPEAVLMRMLIGTIAQSRGITIPHSDMLLEDQATNTYENIVFSARLYDFQGKTVVYLQTPLQQMRTKLNFEWIKSHYGLDCEGISYAPYIPPHQSAYVGHEDFKDMIQVIALELERFILYGPEVGEDWMASVMNYYTSQTIPLERLYAVAEICARSVGSENEAQRIHNAWRHYVQNATSPKQKRSIAQRQAFNEELIKTSLVYQTPIESLSKVVLVVGDASRMQDYSAIEFQEMVKHYSDTILLLPFPIEEDDGARFDTLMQQLRSNARISGALVAHRWKERLSDIIEDVSAHAIRASNLLMLRKEAGKLKASTITYGNRITQAGPRDLPRIADSRASL